MTAKSDLEAAIAVLVGEISDLTGQRATFLANISSLTTAIEGYKSAVAGDIIAEEDPATNQALLDAARAELEGKQTAIGLLDASIASKNIDLAHARQALAKLDYDVLYDELDVLLVSELDDLQTVINDIEAVEAKLKQVRPLSTDAGVSVAVLDHVEAIDRINNYLRAVGTNASASYKLASVNQNYAAVIAAARANT
jgi:multidrug resistance efflux pump